MILHYKPVGSQESQQLRLEAAEDKKVASLWLAAMHKVSVTASGWAGEAWRPLLEVLALT